MNTRQMVRYGSIVAALIISCFGGSLGWAEDAQPSDAAAGSSAQPGGVAPYTGEITDEMISAFIQVDTQIQELRQEAALRTEKIFLEADLKPEIYMAIAQKVRSDASFFERVRAIATKPAS